MNFVYLTSKKYPSKTADHFFVKEMANTFGKILKDKFLLVLAADTSDLFKKINVLTTGLTNERGRTFYYFFWLPFFVIRQKLNSPETIFFSNDPNLLVNLIILRRIFRFKYRICSEWHMLFDDWRDSLIVKGSDFLVATSHRLRELILNRTKTVIDQDKFLVVYGGVDIDRYNALIGRDLRRELVLSKDKILVAYIGLFRTLGTTKGIDTMVEALRYLPEKINMVFVGGKVEEIEAYKKQITDGSLRNRCIFVEKQDISRVPLYQVAVDILVVPSPDKPPFNNYLLPMKVYEYLASRKSIIYSRLPILEEILGDCGFGFIPNDSKNLAEKIMSVVNNKQGDVEFKTGLCYKRAEESTWIKRARGIIDWLNQYC